LAMRVKVSRSATPFGAVEADFDFDLDFDVDFDLAIGRFRFDAPLAGRPKPRKPQNPEKSGY
jgi:hypothetical protein